MAIVDVTITNEMPVTGTITLDSNTKHLIIGSATGVLRFAKTLILTNLSTANSCFVAFKTAASAGTEEYELTKGSTLNLGFDRTSPVDIWIN